MLKCSNRNPSGHKLILLLLLLTTVSCHTLDANFKIQENLTLSIEAFNDEFESKGFNSSARFVHPDHRSNYMQKAMLHNGLTQTGLNSAKKQHEHIIDELNLVKTNLDDFIIDNNLKCEN